MVKMVGVRGRRQMVKEAVMDRGNESWVEGRRQGMVLMMVLGDIVRVIA